ncbi:asparagine synthase (glutamine-hydrolyzing) [Acrocarpospora macrocephala]|uniref:asparagine synthase (glutamine-hydrolyzing) n=1 Tax=Acrocarpospora macrocephala TaxID=150177 RepID=A0A5M3X802_9ACTN|nr:asparagine synthase (glutamine-hydrolyzing) [Acrocarpospora macrocephala]GES14318.1 asparagine synthetase B [Acrocarpospora macrocephala]
MCGIAGHISSAGADHELVRRMCDALVHRGPDGDGYHCGETAGLGMRRLAIMDVAGGAQPVRNERGDVTAVFNGELYNFPELRAELLAKGHRLASSSDSELITHLYEDYGDDLVRRLRGMFAFALWDDTRQRLLLARDRLGKKPLYYRDHRGSLTFASELKAMDVPRTVDLAALHHYLTYRYVPAPHSIVAGVRKLPPGHVLSWQAGRTDVRRYWRLDASPRPVGDEAGEAERLRELLLDVTRRRLAGERPVGAFLSGGLDSAAVVAAMARVSNAPVRTFTIGFTDPRFDERGPARAVAARYGTDHRDYVITPSAIESVAEVARRFDEPFADASAIPSLAVAQLSSEHVTVVLNGDGGDECFAGYRRHLLMARLDRMRVPGVLGRGLSAAGSALISRGSPGTLPRQAGWALRTLGQPPARRYAGLMTCFDHAAKRALYTPEVAASLAHLDSAALVDEAFAASRAGTTLGRAVDADISTYLPGDLLVKADISTMAHSIEARSPFLDHHLMEWAAGLPDHFRIRKGRTKHLLRTAVAPWLPAETLAQPKKGFGVPLAAWLRTSLRELVHDTLTDHTAGSRGIFQPELVSRMLAEHMAGRDHATRLWTLLQLELWHRSADRPAVPV